MALVVVCDCKRKLRIREHLVGKLIQCPHCRRLLNVIGKAPALIEKAPPPAPPREEPPASSKPTPPAPKQKAASSAPARVMPTKERKPRPEVSKAAANKPRATLEKKKPTTQAPAKPAASPAPPQGSAAKQKSKPLPSDAKQSLFSRRQVLAFGGAGLVVLLLAVGLTSLGFANRARPLVQVTGRVSFDDGQPLTGGQVTFFEMRAEPSAKPAGVIAKGTVQGDGSYRVGIVKEDDGVPEGSYKVVVTPPRPPDPERPPPIWPPFQARFSRYNETPLEFTVTRTSNYYLIKVTR